MTQIFVVLRTRIVVAALPPKETDSTVPKSAPWIVTVVPPPVLPDVGVIERIFGAITKPKPRAVVTRPPVATTDTLTDPAGWGLVTAVICVVLVTLKFVAVVVPNWTFEVPLNPLPVIVTVVPPAMGPVPGANVEMVGGVTNL